mmetsp:Transcript_56092/g.137593  ORF Transcript_56092/g.137593 Transcript_56092/m.137593 type:complete len:87 (-) Transcript_56092:313-573(-)
MFALLSINHKGLWHEIFHPWVVRCNSDKTDCHVFWRKSKTAYVSEHETLVNFMIGIGAYSPKPEVADAAASPVIQAVPIVQATASA